MLTHRPLTAMILACGLAATAGCTRQPDRVGESDVPTAPYSTEDQAQVGKIVDQPLDVSRYSYAQKEDFKKDMGDRLQSIDQAISTMKGTAAEFPQKAAQVENLEKKATSLEGELKAVDSISANNWNTFKSKFRDQVVSLEKQYNDVLAASR